MQYQTSLPPDKAFEVVKDVLLSEGAEIVGEKKSWIIVADLIHHSTKVRCVFKLTSTGNGLSIRLVKTKFSLATKAIGLALCMIGLFAAIYGLDELLSLLTSEVVDMNRALTVFTLGLLMVALAISTIYHGGSRIIREVFHKIGENPG